MHILPFGTGDSRLYELEAVRNAALFVAHDPHCMGCDHAQSDVGQLISTRITQLDGKADVVEYCAACFEIAETWCLPPNPIFARVERIDAAGQPIDCVRCGIEFGDGSGMCRRAVGTDICLECAIEPYDREDRGHNINESPSYRDAMIDSGRGHLLS